MGKVAYLLFASMVSIEHHRTEQSGALSDTEYCCRDCNP